MKFLADLWIKLAAVQVCEHVLCNLLLCLQKVTRAHTGLNLNFLYASEVSQLF